MIKSILLNNLKEWGCNIDVGLDRMVDDEDFYESCLSSFRMEKGFDELGKYLVNNDVKKAFDCAHMLKGLTGNLEITPIYNAVCEIVEQLRGGKTDGTDITYKKIIELFNEYLSMF